MPAATYFEQALANFVSGLAAVQALFPAIPVRVIKLAQNDALPAILIGPDEEIHANDLSGRGGLISWSGKVRVVGKVFSDLRALLEAIRENGTTPGTGLAGFSGPMNGWAVKMATLEKSEFDFIFYEDATDEGDFIIDTTCKIEFVEAV